MTVLQHFLKEGSFLILFNILISLQFKKRV